MRRLNSTCDPETGAHAVGEHSGGTREPSDVLTTWQPQSRRVRRHRGTADMTPSRRGSAQLRSLALGTLFPGFEGRSEPPAWLRRMAAEGLGGVVLFGRNIDPEHGDAGVARLAAALHDAGPDLVIAVDEEGGDVTRLDVAHGSSLPGNAALGALDDPSATEQVAAELGARLRACGIDLNFAPVADVDAHPDNPVIGVRSFGFDPELVARHVAAFVAGQQSQGVAATAKHFPGHGATSEDSHLTEPVLDAALEVIRQRELPPFQAAIKADVGVIMTAHIRVPALDPDAPATLSAPAITGLLRDELGFDGVVMTDGLDMHAISRTVGHAEAAVQALLAGVDALCIGGDTVGPEPLERIVDTMVDAVRSGRLPERRLAEAAFRVRSLRRRLRAVSPAPLARGAAANAAVRAVTTSGDVALPDAPVVIELQDRPSIAAGAVPWGVGRQLAERLDGTVVVPVNESGPDARHALTAHPGRPVVVAVRGVRRQPWQADVVRAVRAARPEAIVVDHGTGTPPEVLGERYVLAHGAARITAEAAADLLASRSRPLAR